MSSTNFAKFTAKHLWWRLLLIKLNLFYRTCPNGCLGKMNQNRKTPVVAGFLVQLQTCVLTNHPKRGSIFSMKIGKFYRTSILQNNASRLLLISCDIFNLLASSVINQFSHSMKIKYYYYVSNNICIIYYYLSIILVIMLGLYYYYHVNIIILVLIL